MKKKILLIKVNNKDILGGTYERNGLKILSVILVIVVILQYNSVMAVSQEDLDNVNSEIEDKKEELEDVQNEKSETMQDVENLSNTNCRLSGRNR